MMVSPFTFYRGAALPMASDLSRTPVSGLAVQACGDAHLSNFGIFGSAERRLVFDVNDFDETNPARGNGTSSGWPPAWKSRAAATGSAAGNAARSSPQRSPGTGRRCAVSPGWPTWTSGTRMRTWMNCGRSSARSSKRGSARWLTKGMAKAQTRDSMQELAKLTHLVDGRPQIISDPPLLVPVAELLPRTQTRLPSKRRSKTCSASTGGRWKPTAGSCWRRSPSPTWPVRSSVSAAWGPAAGSC